MRNDRKMWWYQSGLDQHRMSTTRQGDKIDFNLLLLYSNFDFLDYNYTVVIIVISASVLLKKTGPNEQ